MIGIAKTLFKSNVKVGSGASYDTDAQAYFTANTSITSAADKTAINDFYLGLKTDGIYTKIKMMYFPIWLTASNCKWNLINNRTFDLNFSTGWTFTNSGMKGNGTSAYANTFFIPSVNLTANDSQISVYSRTNIDEYTCDIGVTNSSLAGNPECSAILRFTNNFYGRLNIPANNRLLVSNSNSQGLFILNSNGNNIQTAYRNKISLGNNTQAKSNVTTYPITLGAFNNNNAFSLYSTKQCCFYSSGNGFTTTEITNFSDRVNTLMTYFGINTY